MHIYIMSSPAALFSESSGTNEFKFLNNNRFQYFVSEKVSTEGPDRKRRKADQGFSDWSEKEENKNSNERYLCVKELIKQNNL